MIRAFCEIQALALACVALILDLTGHQVRVCLGLGLVAVIYGVIAEERQ